MASKRRGLRRDRPLTWRSALGVFVPLAILTAGVDAAFVATATTRCPRCGGYHLRWDITTAALALTGLACYAAVALWRELRNAFGRQAKPPAAVAKSADRKQKP